MPITVRTTPTDMKKNIDARRLAVTGSGVPTISGRKYRRTPETNASTKLTTAETNENFCNTPFLLVMLVKLPDWIIKRAVGANNHYNNYIKNNQRLTIKEVAPLIRFITSSHLLIM